MIMQKVKIILATHPSTNASRISAGFSLKSCVGRGTQRRKKVFKDALIHHREDALAGQALTISCRRAMTQRRENLQRFHSNGFLTLLLASLALLSGSLAAQGQQELDGKVVEASVDSPTKVVAQSPYAVAARDGNQKTWSKTTWESNSLTGELILKTNSFVELTTASSHLVNGQWVDSSDQIQITETGARAANSQHKVEFLGNINSAGAIHLTLPEGDKHLTSTPIGLSYFDTSNGKSVLIAELKDSFGQLLPSRNQVLYQNAFTDFSADILYINAISGFEQLIVLRQQPPSPAGWGLDPETTVLQVITEFLNPPIPQITQRKVGGMLDEHLDFGATQMPKGYAFALGAETNTIPVTKQWLILDGRQCLIESAPFNRLAPLLKELPAPSGEAALQKSFDPILHKLASGHLLPARKFAKIQTGSLLLARSSPFTKGVAIDYATATSQTNFTFQADTTYYVSSNVTLSGTTVLEGGTVIKFTNSANAKLSMSGSASLVCKTGPYRMAVLTSKDDNTVGETIPGGTGSPTNSSTTYLDGPDGNTTYQYLRLSYAGTAIHAYSPREVKHCQFLRCSTAVTGEDSTDLMLRNVLFSLCGTAVSIGGGSSLTAEHVTADQVNKFFDAPFCTGKLTNSILTSVTNSLGTNVSLYFCTSNSSGSGIYQTVGAAAYYLADSSTNIDSGTTAINTNLLTELKGKTIYPPILWTNHFTASTNLLPQAGRDTNTPDRGYHYDPLDYVISGQMVTNSTLTLTNGVAVGTYGTSSGQGFLVKEKGNLISSGSPTKLNQIVRYNTVQEQSSTNWSANSVAPSVRMATYNTTAPKASFRFTSWSLLGGKGEHFYADYPYIPTPIGFMDCQFGAGGFTALQCAVGLTNCLFDRSNLTLDDDGDYFPYYAFNNLFRVGNVSLSRNSTAPWIFKDNLLDKSGISGFGITHSNNAYVSGYTRLTPTNSNDIVLTNSPIYLTSYLGNYYYPTNGGLLSTLINAGSRNATNALLYHYCTTTNQLKEASSTVDIGFHYVATDSNGNPIDTNDDGAPDYIADTNGNGFQEFGEIAFGITIENPVNGSVLNK